MRRKFGILLATLLGVSVFLYGGHSLVSVEVFPSSFPKLYRAGQLVAKHFQRSALVHLKKRIPGLRVALQFGPSGEYSLLSFSPSFPVELAGRIVAPYATWVEPNYLVFLAQQKKRQEGKRKRAEKVKNFKKKEGMPLSPVRDSYFLKQWGLYNFGQDAPGGLVGKKGAHIDILRAWAIAKGSEEVIVAVLDTGIDYTHPDLEENMWINEKEKYGIEGYDDDQNGFVDDVYGWNFVPADKRGDQAGSPDPMDDNGHGTHCAGIIGAKVNNLRGVAGINWKVRLMALKFLNATGSGDMVGMYRAIQYAIRNKARIINCSFGSSTKSRLGEDAIQAALKAGILIVAAAGNSGTSNDRKPHYPASYRYENVISVAASDNTDKLAPFSNFGAETVDVAAPGVFILSTFPKGRYRVASGTSMAAPMVSGVAALLLSKEPKLTPKEVKERILATSEPLPDLVGRVKSFGRLNAYYCLKNFRPERKFFDPAKMVVEDYRLESIHYPTTFVDHVYKIQKKGAKYIRVHFQLVLTEEKWDYVEVLDGQYRKVDSISGYVGNSWSAWVQGDTILIRLYAAPPFDVKSVQRGDATVLQITKGRASRSFGFSIDKIGYIR